MSFVKDTVWAAYKKAFFLFFSLDMWNKRYSKSNPIITSDKVRNLSDIFSIEFWSGVEKQPLAYSIHKLWTIWVSSNSTAGQEAQRADFVYSWHLKKKKSQHDKCQKKVQIKSGGTSWLEVAVQHGQLSPLEKHYAVRRDCNKFLEKNPREVNYCLMTSCITVQNLFYWYLTTSLWIKAHIKSLSLQ